MPFVHLPVQSGSDRILAAMNRKHTAARLPRRHRPFPRARQDIAFSSDFIVGFPGETEEDFAATLALVTQIGYAAAYSFKYSPRPGHAGGGHAGDGVSLRDGRAIGAAPGPDRQPAIGLQPGRDWHDGRCAVRAAGAQGGPDRRPHRLSAARACDGFARHHRKDPACAVDSLERYSLLGHLATPAAFAPQPAYPG